MQALHLASIASRSDGRAGAWPGEAVLVFIGLFLGFRGQVIEGHDIGPQRGVPATLAE